MHKPQMRQREWIQHTPLEQLLLSAPYRQRQLKYLQSRYTSMMTVKYLDISSMLRLTKLKADQMTVHLVPPPSTPQQVLKGLEWYMFSNLRARTTIVAWH
ncbi:uncharacterized protein LOC124280582 isoform X2 [Haliotis rubra]|uniref:uncharacterized protein LOC124280582 isoform X2 n=1 Tax=Haliotis rubra TaxID=36100 RepID=UPI001EE5946A|nr:uncharacterized protein LOC124280582 isoform X2 [Haliotis rubra]